MNKAKRMSSTKKLNKKRQLRGLATTKTTKTAK